MLGVFNVYIIGSSAERFNNKSVLVVLIQNIANDVVFWHSPE